MKPTDVIVATTLLGGACGDHSAKPDPAPVATEAPARDTTAAQALFRDPVTQDSYARKVLYTWTTTDQIEELRGTRVLLSREESPEHGASYYEQVVHGLAPNDPIAKLLDTTTFAKSRFAWPHPWATREGWPGESYGDQLIRVMLKPDAIVVAISTAKGVIGAHDLDDREVPLTEVAAHPERIAAIYFTSIVYDEVARGVPRPPSDYREYVLVNESMIATYSAGTGDILTELASSAASLDALADVIRNRAVTVEISAGWTSVMAFQGNDNYRLAVDQVAMIAKHLRQTPRPKALEGGGHATWSGIGPARSIRVKKPVPRGTYSTFYRGTY